MEGRSHRVAKPQLCRDSLNRQTMHVSALTDKRPIFPMFLGSHSWARTDFSGILAWDCFKSRIFEFEPRSKIEMDHHWHMIGSPLPAAALA
jgi:hypothetical protein